jgi:hypothetical protein
MRYTVTIPHKIYLSKTTPQSWARANCPSYLSATLHLQEDHRRSTAEFNFSDEKDATLFALKWL